MIRFSRFSKIKENFLITIQKDLYEFYLRVKKYIERENERFLQDTDLSKSGESERERIKRAGQ